MNSKLNKRIRNLELQEKIMTAERVAKIIKDGMIIAISGFTPAGYPKAVPLALAKRVKKSKEKLQISLLIGASVGEELDGALTEAGIIARRYLYQTNKSLRHGINSGKITYADIHLSHFAQQVRYGFFGELDFAIIEAVAMTRFGIILTLNQIPAQITSAILGITNNPYIILLPLNVLVLLVVCFMETIGALIIITPLLLPLATAAGLSPLAFGVILYLNLSIGMMTPPVGVNLFVISGISKVTIADMGGYVLYFFIALVIPLFLITYFPKIIEFLPNLLRNK